MPLTTVRVDDALLKEAKELGINVSEAAREGIRKAILKQRMLDNIDWLAAHAVPAKEPSEVAVRRMRDIMAHHDPALSASENLIRNRAALWEWQNRGAR